MRSLLKKISRKTPVMACGAAVLLVAASSAHATLGGQPGGTGLTRATAQQALAATQTPTTTAYTTQVSTTDAGTVVREYLGADGAVFAVTWNGPLMPNLSSLLGEYFPQYTAKTALPSRSHNLRLFNDSSLVVQSTGHMHAFSGLAYLPQKLPAGMTVENLK